MEVEAEENLARTPRTESDGKIRRDDCQHYAPNVLIAFWVVGIGH